MTTISENQNPDATTASEDLHAYMKRAITSHFVAIGDPSHLEMLKGNKLQSPVNLWECNFSLNSTKFLSELKNAGLVEGVDFDKLSFSEHGCREIFVRALSLRAKVLFKFIKREPLLFDESWKEAGV